MLLAAGVCHLLCSIQVPGTAFVLMRRSDPIESHPMQRPLPVRRQTPHPLPADFPGHERQGSGPSHGGRHPAPPRPRTPASSAGIRPLVVLAALAASPLGSAVWRRWRRPDPWAILGIAEATEPYDGAALAHAIRRQVAYYFSEDNLPRDMYLLKAMDAEGWVRLSVLANFKRMQSLTTDRSAIAAALWGCRGVELSEDGAWIRKAGMRRRPPPRPRWEDERGQPCKHFCAGHCSYGASCVRSHDPQEGARLEREWLQKGSTLPPSGPRRPQPFPVYFILDLEGKDEIIELPVVALRTADLSIVGRFHRWVRPDSFRTLRRGHANPESVAVPFAAALSDLQEWVGEMEVAAGVPSAFVTCGNWDIKTQIPKQCRLSGVPVPEFLTAWINIKDIYNGLHPQWPTTGMKGLLRKLRIPLEGVHHLGMDDADNIARCAAKLMEDGAVLHITGGLRDPRGPSPPQNPNRVPTVPPPPT